MRPEGGPESPVEAGESRRRHADDRIRMTVQPQHPAHHRGVSIESLTPVFVAQHHDRVGSLFDTLVGMEDSSDLRIDPQDLEERSGHEFMMRAVVPSGAVTQVSPVRHGAGYAIERLRGGVFQLAKNRVRERAEIVVGSEHPDIDQPVRFCVRRVTQGEAVEQAEEGRGAADGDGQREHGNCGKSGCADNPPPTHLDILEQNCGPTSLGNALVACFETAVQGPAWSPPPGCGGSEIAELSLI